MLKNFGLLLFYTLVYPCRAPTPSFDNLLPQNTTVEKCEFDEILMSCEEDGVDSRKYIKLMTLKYGKSSETICPQSSGINELTNTYKYNNRCRFKNAKRSDFARKFCEGQRSCRIDIPVRLGVGDPCPGNYKYTSIKYTCTSRNRDYHHACENQVLQLNCSDSKKIKIDKVIYGRNHAFICNWGDFDESNCISTNALSRVKNICDNKVSCSIHVTNGNLAGDPCPGIWKYLEVQKRCVNNGS